jgi:hypothetical protein
MKIVMPKLNEWQQDLVDTYLQYPTGKWFLIKSPRQVGKSISLEYLLVYASLSERNSVSIAVSPTIGQARKLYNDIVLFASKLIAKSNGSLLYIEFINGSQIHFKSAEQGDSVRGFTTKRKGILVVDEAAYINKDWFYSVVVPITNVYNSDIFLFSTPKYKQGLFYELYVADSEHIIVCDWTNYDLSKYLTPELLELYREQLPKAAFQSEYLAEFIDGDGAVFTDFKKCVGSVEFNRLLPLHISIDWGTGTGSDDTAITLGQYDGQKMLINKQLYFNDKKTNETTDYILDLIKMYVRKGFREINIVVEHNSIGQVYYDILHDKIDEFECNYNDSLDDWRKEIEINLSQFTTTNKSKKKIIEKLTMLFENDNIVIPNDSKLLTQLSMFEATINNNGTVVYKGANNSHDDLVMSLCFLVDSLDRYTE